MAVLRLLLIALGVALPYAAMSGNSTASLEARPHIEVTQDAGEVKILAFVEGDTDGPIEAALQLVKSDLHGTVNTAQSTEVEISGEGRALAAQSTISVADSGEVQIHFTLSRDGVNIAQSTQIFHRENQ